MHRWLYYVTLLVILPCMAEMPEKITDINQAILHKLHTAYPPNSHLNFTVGYIDSRLKLSKCTQPLDVFFPNHQNTSRILVGVRCHGVQPWKIYVTVTVRQMQQVVVVKDHLMPGASLSAENLALEKRNIAEISQNYLSDMDEAKGMTLKRAVKAGTILNKSMLKSPLYVKRGDLVQVIAQKGQFRIRTSAIAQKNGTINENTPVKNMSTKKIFMVQIIDKDVTRVIF